MYFLPMSFVWEVAQWSTLTRSSSNTGMIISRIKECENPTDWERLSVLAGMPSHFSFKFHIFPGANSTQIWKEIEKWMDVRDPPQIQHRDIMMGMTSEISVDGRPPRQKKTRNPSRSFDLVSSRTFHMVPRKCDCPRVRTILRVPWIVFFDYDFFALRANHIHSKRELRRGGAQKCTSTPPEPQ